MYIFSYPAARQTASTASFDYVNTTKGFAITPRTRRACESDGPDAFTVRLSFNPTGPVSFTITSSDNTVAGPHATDASVTGTFVPTGHADYDTAGWDKPQAFQVHYRQDTDSDNENATLDITATGGGYDNVTGQLTVELDDDDYAASTAHEMRPKYNAAYLGPPLGRPLRTREGDIRWQNGNQISTMSLSAEMNMPPVCRGSITVTATSSDPGAVLLATRRGAADSELAQTVSKTTYYSDERWKLWKLWGWWVEWVKFYVVALDDVDADDETVTITLTTSGDYPTITKTVTVIVEDDD